MDQLRILLCTILILSSAWARGGLKATTDLPTQIVNKETVYHVGANGSYDFDQEVTIQINNDEGRRQYAFLPIEFDSDTTSVKIISAMSSTRDGRQTPVANVEKIKPEKSTSIGQPLTFKKIVIPFANLETLSRVQYKVRYTMMKPTVPGLFAISLSWGLTTYEQKSSLLIKSQKPLHYKANKIATGLITIESAKDGDFHTLRLTQRAPAFFAPAGDELAIDARSLSLPQIDISTSSSWHELVSLVAPRFEDVLSQPLPGSLEKIAKNARNKVDDSAKINFVLERLSAQLFYSGGGPLSISDIAQKDLAQIAKGPKMGSLGFATLTAAVLRQLGFKSDVVFVQRAHANGQPGIEPVQDEKGALPAFHYFTHAIVKAKPKNGETRWIDPTNDLLRAEGIAEEFADSPALVLTSESPILERTPHLAAFKSTILVERHLKIRPDLKASYKIDFTATGADAFGYRQLARSKDREMVRATFEKAMSAEHPDASSGKLRHDSKSKQGSYFDAHLEFSGQVPLQKGNSGKIYLLDPMPLVSSYFVALTKNKSRTTSIYLGTPGETREINHVVGVFPEDEVEGDCLVYSDWLDLSRTVRRSKDGLIVDTRVTRKKQTVSIEELRSETFKIVHEQLARCTQAPFFALETAGSLAPAAASVRKGKNSATASDTRPFNLQTLSLLAAAERPARDQRLAVSLSSATFENGLELLFGPKSDDVHFQYLKAKRIFEKILETEPTNALALSWLGAALESLGHLSGAPHNAGYFKAALTPLNSAVTLAPQDPIVRRLRASNYVAILDVDKARADFHASYAKDPKSYETLKLGAKIANAAKRNSEAERWMFAAYAAADTPQLKADALQNLGDLYMSFGQFEKAIQTYRTVLQTTTNELTVLQKVTLAYLAIIRYDDAIASARKAYEVSKTPVTQGDLVVTLVAKAKGLLWEKQQNFISIKESLLPQHGAVVETLLNEALQLDANHTDALHLAGDLQFHKVLRNEYGSIQRAKEYYSRYLENAQADPFALAAYEHVVYSPVAGRDSFQRRLTELTHYFAAVHPGPHIWSDIQGKRHFFMIQPNTTTSGVPTTAAATAAPAIAPHSDRAPASSSSAKR